jgi:hypothetical protein
LNADGPADRPEVLDRWSRQPGLEPLFADGGELVGHGFAGLAIQVDQGFTRV